MSKDFLNEREFELVNIIGQKLGSNQRNLSIHMNLSLGQTNMLIRRLVAKGYIRITQLNQKKVQYLLTPKGISEKFKKSIKYTLNTINSMGLIKKGLRDFFLRLYGQSENVFYVFGESDFIFLVESVIRELDIKDITVHYINDISEAKPDGILCIAKEDYESAPLNRARWVNLLQELAKQKELVTSKA